VPDSEQRATVLLHNAAAALAVETVVSAAESAGLRGDNLRMTGGETVGNWRG